jgi:hypothetical protein
MDANPENTMTSQDIASISISTRAQDMARESLMGHLALGLALTFARRPAVLEIEVEEVHESDDEPIDEGEPTERECRGESGDFMHRE